MFLCLNVEIVVFVHRCGGFFYWNNCETGMVANAKLALSLLVILTPRRILQYMCLCSPASSIREEIVGFFPEACLNLLFRPKVKPSSQDDISH